MLLSFCVPTYLVVSELPEGVPDETREVKRRLRELKRQLLEARDEVLRVDTLRGRLNLFGTSQACRYRGMVVEDRSQTKDLEEFYLQACDDLKKERDRHRRRKNLPEQPHTQTDEDEVLEMLYDALFPSS